MSSEGEGQPFPTYSEKSEDVTLGIDEAKDKDATNK
jgi:hypothetical protein